ncbi:MAG: alternative ribosome rescue aminoacyl-tRNA hydrolase ArfB [Planctomycetaceae bacterium]
MLTVTDTIQIPDTEFSFSFARSGGPGGQNVNKVNSKAILHWNVTQSPSLPQAVKERFLERFRRRLTTDGILVLNSQRYRDQGRNVLDCMEKLRALILEAAVTPKKRRPTKPGKGAQQRRLQNKRQQSEKKQSRRRPGVND